MQPIINTNLQNIHTDNISKLRMKNLDVKDNDAKLKEAAQGFEAIFVTKLLNQMHSSSMNEGGFIGQSNSEKMFKGMMFQEIGKEVAKTSSFGIADAIYKQMKNSV